jgi:histidyl-tRNA synthetase
MNDNKIKILKNFKDTDSSDLKLRREIEINSLNYLIGSNYINLDTPVIESADLFFRKSLGSTSGNTYTFVDPLNQQVSLRPDFTASVMRHVFTNLKNKKNYEGKYCYSGPVFKFENSQKSYHQSYQVGAEYISSDNEGYESEVILDSVECLNKNAIKEFKINLGNVGIVRKFLYSLDLNSSLVEFFLTNLKLFNLEKYEESLLTKAKFQNLIKSNEKITKLSKNDIETKFKTQLDSNIGFRSKNDIVGRYLNKLSNQIDEQKFIDSINKLKQLLGIDLGSLRKSSNNNLNLEVFNALIKELLANGIKEENICVDFSLTRNLAYYNGVVFYLIYKDKLIGGGGRYDGLPSMLGFKQDFFCFGFAIDISKLTDILNRDE